MSSSSITDEPQAIGQTIENHSPLDKMGIIIPDKMWWNVVIHWNRAVKTIKKFVLKPLRVYSWNYSWFNQSVKNPPEMQEIQETGVQSFLREESPGKGNGNPLQYYRWEIPWTEESGRFQFIRSQRVWQNWATKPACTILLIYLVCMKGRVFLLFI